MSKVWSILLALAVVLIGGISFFLWSNKPKESVELPAESVSIQVDNTVSANTEETIIYPKGEMGPEDTGPEPVPDPIDGVEVWDVMTIRPEMQKHIAEIAEYSKTTYPDYTSITCITYTDLEYKFKVDGTDLGFIVLYDEASDTITFKEPQ